MPIFAVTLIWQFQQNEGIKVHKPSPRQYDQMEDAEMEYFKVFITHLQYLGHCSDCNTFFTYEFREVMFLTSSNNYTSL